MAQRVILAELQKVLEREEKWNFLFHLRSTSYMEFKPVKKQPSDPKIEQLPQKSYMVY